MRIALATVAVTMLAASLVAQSPAPSSEINAESLSRLPVVAREGLDADGKRVYDYIARPGRHGPENRSGRRVPPQSGHRRGDSDAESGTAEDGPRHEVL